MLQVFEFRVEVSLTGVIANKLDCLLGILSWKLLLIVFDKVFKTQAGLVIFAFRDFLVDYSLDSDPRGYFCAVGSWDVKLVLDRCAYWKMHEVGHWAS